MSHSHTCLLIHVVFATKERFAAIPNKLLEKLWAFTGGIVRRNGMKALQVGGTCDHMHLLLSVPATIPVSKAVQLVKAGSSKFMNQHLQHRFEWQEGYGAFTVGIAQKQITEEYIRNQRAHHMRRGFQEEYASFLQKHGLQRNENGSIVPTGLETYS